MPKLLKVKKPQNHIKMKIIESFQVDYCNNWQGRAFNSILYLN